MKDIISKVKGYRRLSGLITAIVSAIVFYFDVGIDEDQVQMVSSVISMIGGGLITWSMTDEYPSVIGNSRA